MQKTKWLLAFTLFAVVAFLFWRLVDGVALAPSLIIVGVLALSGVALSFAGLPGRPKERER